MVVKTIFVIKHSFGSFEVDSISPVSETANDIRLDRISLANGQILTPPAKKRSLWEHPIFETLRTLTECLR